MSESSEFDVQSIDDLYRVMTIAQGGNPEARQALTDFLQFNNHIERTNLPTRRDVHVVSFLDIVGKSFFPDFQDNPFSLLAESVSIAFMAKGGDKSKQFVELMKQTPSLSDLQAIDSPPERSLRERIFGRGKEE